MKSLFKRLAVLLFILVWLPAAALALTGQTISTFETYYKEDVSFLNENTGRHLLPKDLAVLDLDDRGRMQYSYYDDALHVTITTDGAGIIESCEIRLLIPDGTVYGNSLHRDFTTAGYHSYAMIMAMHMSADASNRYLLVQEISTELEKNFGYYERHLGSYTITCTRVIGEGAVFTFTNSGIAPAGGGSSADGTGTDSTPPPPIVIENDEGANLG